MAAHPVIFESEHLVVYLSQGRDDLGVITFAPMASQAQTNGFWGERPLNRLGVTAVGFVSKAPNWFPAGDMAAAASAVRSHLSRCRNVISYGTSMGGYGALKYSNLLSANFALSFSPQYSIKESELMGKDRRFTEFYRPELHGESMAVKEEDVCRRAFVFYDPYFRVDKLNAELIGNACPRVTDVVVGHTGHAVIELFASGERLQTLFWNCLRDEVSTLRETAVRYYRDSDLRKRTLVDWLARKRGPDVALAAYRKHISAYNSVHSSRFLATLSGIFLQQEKLAEADTVSMESLVLSPEEPHALFKRGEVLRALDRKSEAIRAIEMAVKLNPNAPVFRSRLAELREEVVSH